MRKHTATKLSKNIAKSADVLKRLGFGHLAAILAGGLIVSAFPTGTATAFAGGDGSEASPYQISNCMQLQDMQDDSLAHYTLTQDIDCSTTPEWNENDGFIPIGNSPITGFQGVLDGAGYTIHGLYVNKRANNYGGLFGYIASNATVTNLKLRDFDVRGNNDIGALGGHNGGNVSNVSATGSAFGSGQVIGGLVGRNQGFITRSDATVSVDANGNNVGGLVGVNEGEIHRSFARGDVYSEGTAVGGLVGLNWGDIARSYSNNGEQGVTGCQVGGVVGSNENGYVQNTYSRSTITNTGACAAGGFIGYFDGDARQSYSTGNISSGEGSVWGGSIGNANMGYVASVLWDIESSGTDAACGVSDEIDCGSHYALSGWDTDEMKLLDTFTTAQTEDAWDFDNIWTLDPTTNDGYPSLRNVGSSYTTTETDEDDSENDNEDNQPGQASVDMNGDGTPDADQPHVQAFKNTATGRDMVVELNNTCSLSSATAKQESDFTVADAGYNYVDGFAAFTANCGTPGYTSNVKIYYYDTELSGQILRKHNANTNAYFTLDESNGVSMAQRTINNKTVTVATYDITDGGPLDMDGQANGVIVDPAGLATQAVTTPNTGLGGGQWR